MPHTSAYAYAVSSTMLTLFWGSVALAETPRPPMTEKRQVSDTFHGTTVAEDYRWLEDSSNPQVQQWSDAQNAYARAILDQLPNRETIAARVREIMSAETVSYYAVAARGGKFFAMKHQPPKQQPFLIVSDSLDDLSGERVLVDPNTMDEKGSSSIVWFKPSPDGKLVAVCMASGGDEVGDVTVFDVAAGKPVHERIPRVNTGTAGGDLAWAPDGSGFYYTRHPRQGERPAEDMNFYQQVYFHKLGTPTADDRYELGKESPRIAETELKVDPRTGRVIATIQYGDGGQFAHYLREVDGQWRQFTRFEDGIIQVEFGHSDDLYVVSRRDAPRGKIVHVPVKTIVEADDWQPRGDAAAIHPAIEAAETVVPEGEDAIVTSFWRDSTVKVTDARLYVVYQLGGPTELRAFDLDGKPLPAPKQLPVASVGALEELHGDDVLFDMESYTQPAAVYLFNASSGNVTKTAFDVQSPVTLDDAEVVRELATSKDGTKVPVNILYRQGLHRNGQNPTLANAYGGYGVSIQPAFRSLNRVLLDHGFVVAVANVRGGGEYGEEWHRQGNLANKQNVFDDFAAVLQHLIERNYTSREKLAIIGGSNGGLLMGATLTQHPDLMQCVVAQVGIYDMLRVELSPNGAFNVTEFGTVKDPEQFRALYAYSPYHHVEDGVDYPAVLFMTGENDPRVDPMQSRKMVARLQAASPAGGPFLLRTSSDTGHGQGTPLDERIAQQVDVFAFIFSQLGVTFQAK